MSIDVSCVGTLPRSAEQRALSVGRHTRRHERTDVQARRTVLMCREEGIDQCATQPVLRGMCPHECFHRLHRRQRAFDAFIWAES